MPKKKKGTAALRVEGKEGVGEKGVGVTVTQRFRHIVGLYPVGADCAPRESNKESSGGSLPRSANRGSNKSPSGEGKGQLSGGEGQHKGKKSRQD